MRKNKCKYCNIYFIPADNVSDRIKINTYNFCCKSHRVKFIASISKKKRDKVKAKRLKAKERKMNSNSYLKKKLDKVFSLYIRLRDCILSTKSLSSFKCITCNEVKTFAQLDAGHFVSRGKYSTRWNDKNVHGQCKACNGFGGGEQYKHGKYINIRYGEGTSEALIQESCNIFRINHVILNELIDEYHSKLKELHKRHNSLFTKSKLDICYKKYSVMRQ